MTAPARGDSAAPAPAGASPAGCGSRLAAGAVAAAASGPACAHAFGQPYDLPLPLSLFLAGAGGAVALTFLVLAVAGSRAGTGFTVAIGGWRLREAVRRVASPALALTGVGLLALAVAAGFAGAQEPLRNIAPVLVMVIAWVGLAYACALLGDLWADLCPWAALHRWGERLLARTSEARPLVDYPEHIGPWPATALLLGFAWVEIVSDTADRPARLAAVLLVYALAMLLGMVAFGRERWLRNADVFSVFYGLLARFAPLGTAPAAGGPGRERWVLRAPGQGLVEGAATTGGLAAFAVLMVANVSFDGFVETPAWTALLEAVSESRTLRPALLALQSRGADLLAIVKTAGLLGFAGAFVLAYLVTCRLTVTASGTRLATADVARRFALTLVPIAIAYHLAHYLSYLLTAGQLVISLASDPFARGWDLFGTAERDIDVTLVGARAVWFAAIGAIVTGHVVSVWLAHAVAIRVFGAGARAAVSQVPMATLMTAYTMLSLWILAQPVVRDVAGG